MQTLLCSRRSLLAAVGRDGRLVPGPCRAIQRPGTPGASQHAGAPRRELSMQPSPARRGNGRTQRRRHWTAAKHHQPALSLCSLFTPHGLLLEESFDLLSAVGLRSHPVGVSITVVCKHRRMDSTGKRTECLLGTGKSDNEWDQCIAV